jgi:hypothetical protein
MLRLMGCPKFTEGSIPFDVNFHPIRNAFAGSLKITEDSVRTQVEDANTPCHIDIKCPYMSPARVINLKNFLVR